jgi:hypothetical protein
VNRHSQHSRACLKGASTWLDDPHLLIRLT